MELLITVVIVGILAALAYPSFTQHIRKSKRGEAQQLLINWSVNQEIYRSNNPTYASTIQLAVPTNDHYDFSTLNPPTASAYILLAIAKASDDQQNDEAKDGSDCSTIGLNQAGLKGPDGCWD